MRALICGYYGEHNLGDDALLEVLLDQLPAGLPSPGHGP
jgi:polysaccharide pyruvyl transferase WcaK-like protein